MSTPIFSEQSNNKVSNFVCLSEFLDLRANIYIKKKKKMLAISNYRVLVYVGNVDPDQSGKADHDLSVARLNHWRQ